MTKPQENKQAGVTPTSEKSLTPGFYRIQFPHLASHIYKSVAHSSLDGVHGFEDEQMTSERRFDSFRSYFEHLALHRLDPEPDPHEHELRNLPSTQIGNASITRAVDSLALRAIEVLPHHPDIRLTFDPDCGLPSYRFVVLTYRPLADDQASQLRKLCIRLEGDLRYEIGASGCTFSINDTTPLGIERAHAVSPTHLAGPSGGEIEQPMHRAAAAFIVNAATARFGAPVRVQVDRFPSLGQDVFRIWSTPAMDVEADDLKAWIQSSLRQDLSDNFQSFERGESTIEVSPLPLIQFKATEPGTGGNAAFEDTLGDPTPGDHFPTPESPSRPSHPLLDPERHPALAAILDSSGSPRTSIFVGCISDRELPRVLRGVVAQVEHDAWIWSRIDLAVIVIQDPFNHFVLDFTSADDQTSNRELDLLIIASKTDGQLRELSTSLLEPFTWECRVAGHLALSTDLEVDHGFEREATAVMPADPALEIARAWALNPSTPFRESTVGPMPLGADLTDLGGAGSLNNQSARESHTHNAVLHGQLKEPQGIAPGYGVNRELQGNLNREPAETPLPAVLETLLHEYGRPKPAAPRESQAPASEPRPVAEKPAPPSAPEPTPEPEHEIGGLIRGVSR